MASDKDFIECKDWSLFHADPVERDRRFFYWLRLAEWTALAACILFVIGLFLPKPAHADSQVSAPDGTVVYVRHDAKCDDADIVAHLTRMGAGERVGEFKKGTLTYGGRKWRSCWIEYQEHVVSVDEEGSPLQPLPVRLFKPVGSGA